MNDSKLDFKHLCIELYVSQAIVAVLTILFMFLTLLHSERTKLYAILAFLSAIGLMSTVLFLQCNS